jgi:hypothetical protein
VKTVGVKHLVEQILSQLPRPFDEDVIEDVFLAIEGSPDWFEEYDQLCGSLGKLVTNSAVGMWVAKYVGRTGAQQVVSTRSKIAGSYSKLVFAGATSGRKLKEEEAARQVWEYYSRNRDKLTKDISRFKSTLVELVMDGTPVEEAFTIVQGVDA